MNSIVHNIDCMNKQHHWFGRKHSEETKQKMRASMLSRINPMKQKEVVEKRSNTLISNGTFAGENHNRWKGGDRKYRGAHWYRAQEERRKFDGYKCQDCGKHQASQNRKLDVHHIIDFKDGGGNDLSNLITLCRSCHNKRRRKS